MMRSGDNPMMKRVALFVLLLSLAYLPAQGVIIVDASGGGDFTDIQSAVDAAPVGGLIRVRHGIYPGPVLITKGLRIIGDRVDFTMSGRKADLRGNLVVRNIPAGQSFVASDLGSLMDGLEYAFENCLGNVHLSRMFTRIRITNCVYVTYDEGGVWISTMDFPPALVVEDSVAVFTNSSWLAIGEVEPAVRMTRSKITFVNCLTQALQYGDPLTVLASAVEIIDSEFIFDKSSSFRVGANLFNVSPPIFIRSGDSTLTRFDGAAMDAEQEEEILNLFLLNSSSVTTIATMASLPRSPVELPNGRLYLDLSRSVFLFLGERPSSGPIVSLPIPRVVEKLGVPVTIQSAELIDGKLRLSLPITVVQ